VLPITGIQGLFLSIARSKPVAQITPGIHLILVRIRLCQNIPWRPVEL